MAITNFHLKKPTNSLQKFLGKVVERQGLERCGMKKTLLITLILITVLTSSAFAEVKRGVVTFVKKDIIVIYDGMYYCGAELFSGEINKGDIVIGDGFSRYGRQEIYRVSTDRMIMVYIDEIRMWEDGAQRWIARKTK